MKNKKVMQFINNYLLAALKNEKQNGVPYLAALAQAALETGWGVYVKGFNFFGIKAGSKWKGKKQIFKTSEVEDGKKIIISDTFRAYESFDDSIKNYSEFLKDRFSKAFDKKDPVEFVSVLQNDYEHKYATDPKYIDKIKSIVGTLNSYIDKNTLETLLRVVSEDKGGEQPPKSLKQKKRVKSKDE